MDFMNITFKQYECTRKHTTAPKTKYLRVLIYANANIFLSATVLCYIAASPVIFIWILHLHFLSLSVCVIVSNAGLDVSLHSNRGRLPLPAARTWGPACIRLKLSFCLVSAKGGARVKEWGEWETGWGRGASKERPPALRLRFPSVGKRGATYTKNTDWCKRTSAHKHRHDADIHTHTLFFCGWGLMMTETGDTQADRQPDPHKLRLMGETLCRALCISRFWCL